MAKVSREISSKIKFEGDAEYRRKLEQINQTLGNVKAEMYKVTAEYQNNAKSVEALTEKHRILEAREKEQADKVQLLKEVLEKVKGKYKESSEEVSELTNQLYYAEGQWSKTVAEIENCDNALDEAEKGIDDFMEETTGLGDILGSIGDKFGISIPEGMKTSLNGMAEFSASSVIKIGAVATAVKLVVDAVIDLAETTKQVAGYVDDLNTTATTSGIDTYTLQVLNYMEDLADTDVSTVTGSMTKLTKAMDNARNGTASTVEAFNQLGVAWEDGVGNLRDSQDVFWEAIDALGKIQNETERDAVAMDLFGKSAKDLNTLIAVGSEGFKEFASEAEDAGYILSEKQNKALNDYNDALDRATKMQDAMDMQMASIMAPALQKLTEGWSNLVTEGIQLLIDSGIIDFLATLVKGIGYVIEFVGDMIEVINALLHPIASLRELLGYSNTTLEENALLTKNATKNNDAFTDSVSATTDTVKKETEAVNNATESLRKYAEQLGYIDITDERLAELGSYSTANAERGEGFFGAYANYTKAQFKELLDENGITSASQISDILGEDAYRYYKASAFYNASGNQNYEGGWTWVGENGTELAHLPQGTQIYNAQESRDMVGATYNITIDASNVKEFNDIIRIVKNSRRTTRMRA